MPQVSAGHAAALGAGMFVGALAGSALINGGALAALIGAAAASPWGIGTGPNSTATTPTEPPPAAQDAPRLPSPPDAPRRIPALDILLPHGLATLPAWLAMAIAIAVPVALALLLGRGHVRAVHPCGIPANAVVGAVKYGFVVEDQRGGSRRSRWWVRGTRSRPARDTLQKEASGLYMLAHAVDTYDGPQFEGHAR